MSRPSHQHANKLDIAGISLSVICVAHCLFFPAAAAAAPLLTPAVSDLIGVGHEWHLVLLLVAAPISLFGLGWGVRATQGGRTLWILGIAGLALMALGASHLFGELAETVLTLTGVTVLAYAHFQNWQSRRAGGHDHERDCGLCEHGDAH